MIQTGADAGIGRKIEQREQTHRCQRKQHEDFDRHYLRPCETGHGSGTLFGHCKPAGRTIVDGALCLAGGLDVQNRKAKSDQACRHGGAIGIGQTVGIISDFHALRVDAENAVAIFGDDSFDDRPRILPASQRRRRSPAAVRPCAPPTRLAIARPGNLGNKGWVNGGCGRICRVSAPCRNHRRPRHGQSARHRHGDRPCHGGPKHRPFRQEGDLVWMRGNSGIGHGPLPGSARTMARFPAWHEISCGCPSGL